ncbi:hypothetical protein KFE96_11330 [Kordiimonas sp. SCSIO 12603]|uniref:two-component system sensor histidine kinase NtrB n=1 Tax=Kordiimonas sp. SCSIO 12603 TaxID=2829596 RepID=UPI002104537D|nr:ATP-binding protein [Kordiimonas sp. SCSIO 12603]UTW57442.1 hypothetical protein KFE96_11330 [Kordiimonas sp. SCSIO 12603]
METVPSGELGAPEAVLNSLHQATLLISADNIITQIYSHTEAIFQQSEEVLIGQSIRALRSIGLQVEELVDRSRQEVTPLNSYDVACGPPIGDIELMDLHASPYGEEGEILITAQPRRITAYLEKREEMEAAARSVSGLASMLAHEIKNPLSGIRGAAQLIARSSKEGDDRLPELIVKEVDRIKSLVDELETFSTPTAQENEAVNIHEVLDHVLNVAAAGFGEKAEFEPKFDPSLPDVYGNYDRLIQVFLNLVKNAVEAAGDTAKITVTTRYQHGIWIREADGSRKRLPIEISIHDNGPGIPENLKNYLFDPFVSGKEGGSGLGLALVARYISEMGGTVTFDNHPKGGAVFKVQLALDEDKKV